MKKIAIAVPVYSGNYSDIEKNIPLLVNSIKNNIQFAPWAIVIAINGSHAEKIINLSQTLSNKFHPFVTYTTTPHSGKGWGIFHCWEKVDSDIKVFLDVDLSTNPNSIHQLLSPLMNENYDIVMGSRYHPLSKIKRSWIRYGVSWIYNHIFIKRILKSHYSDLQCGFKAISANAFHKIKDLVKDREWFFETEMIYIAERQNLRIKEIPIEWREGHNSGVKLLHVIPQFIQKIFELRKRLP